eukprot:gene13292-28149_t
MVALTIINTFSNGQTTSSCSLESSQLCNLQLPVIDIASFVYHDHHSDDEREIVVSAVRAATRDWGLFHVIGHGLEDSQKEIISEARRFFQLPLEEKYKVKRTVNNSRGFADDELTKQKRDMKQILDIGHKPFSNLSDSSPENVVLDGYNQYPDETVIPGFRNQIDSYYSNCTHLGSLLISIIAMSLNLSNDHFKEYFDNHSSFLRLNYYPIHPNLTSTSSSTSNSNSSSRDNILGISRHTDAGALTILLQDDVSSLEVYSGTKEDANDGIWIPVDPIPKAFTINTGDMMQVWSNNRIHAPEHRVKASTTKERYSLAFFYNPNYEAIIAPCSSLLSMENEREIQSERSGNEVETPLYKPISWGEFRSLRFKGDYADYGTEVQIDHFLY